MDNNTASQPDLRIAFLVGGDNPSTRLAIERVSRVPGIKPIAVLVDTATVPFKRRSRNLIRNIRRNGWKYPISRLVAAARMATDQAMTRAAVSPSDVDRLLRQTFPGRCFSLQDLGREFEMDVKQVGNLNGPEAIRSLRECKLDLGVVIGTRVLKPTTFSIPRLGCINLHKGKVPEYRGMPPAFWELYDGASAAGVTIHFIDQGLDTGDIIASAEIPISRLDTPETLLEKLHEEGARLLAGAVLTIQDGSVNRQPQQPAVTRPRTNPTQQQVAQLRSKLPHWQKKSNAAAIARNLYTLLVYHSGMYLLVRKWHSFGASRAAVLLHHRVNDYSRDVLTVDCRTLAAQLLAITKRYPVCSTTALVNSVRAGIKVQPTTVGIHFDDCYRDVLLNGAPILNTVRAPACAFINSGFVDTDKRFPHDFNKSPFHFENLGSGDLRTLHNSGFEIGAHTVNHTDLGSCSLETARTEITRCGEDLGRIIGKPINYFSFPFGLRENIRPGTRDIVKEAGYLALFSAHGGFTGRRTSPYDIPRMGVSHECAPVYCLLLIENLTPGQLGEPLRLARNSLRRLIVEKSRTLFRGGPSASRFRSADPTNHSPIQDGIRRT